MRPLLASLWCVQVRWEALKVFWVEESYCYAWRVGREEVQQVFLVVVDLQLRLERVGREEVQRVFLAVEDLQLRLERVVGVMVLMASWGVVVLSLEEVVLTVEAQEVFLEVEVLSPELMVWAKALQVF